MMAPDDILEQLENSKNVSAHLSRALVEYANEHDIPFSTALSGISHLYVGICILNGIDEEDFTRLVKMLTIMYPRLKSRMEDETKS